MIAGDAVCCVDACSQPLYQSAHYCGAHRARFYRYGDPVAEPKPWRQDLTGQRFGALTALEYDLPQRAWTCLCDCGARSLVRAWSLTSGGTRTCGQRRRHLTPRTYQQAHDYVRATRGRAAEHACVRCLRTAQHWAYKHATAGHRIESSYGPWSPSPQDYEPLCVACHKRADLHTLEVERATSHGLHPLF